MYKLSHTAMKDILRGTCCIDDCVLGVTAFAAALLILMPFNLTFAAREHFHRIETENAWKALRDDIGITKVQTIDNALGMNAAHTKSIFIQSYDDKQKSFKIK